MWSKLVSIHLRRTIDNRIHGEWVCHNFQFIPIYLNSANLLIPSINKTLTCRQLSTRIPPGHKPF
jgi:glutamine synthetase type III